MILARLLNLIGAPANAARTQTGEAVAPNLPTRLQPAQRVHRRKVHAVARDMRRDAGMPVSEALGA